MVYLLWDTEVGAMIRSTILLYSTMDAQWDGKIDSDLSIYLGNGCREENNQRIEGFSDPTNHPRVRHIQFDLWDRSSSVHDYFFCFFASLLALLSPVSLFFSLTNVVSLLFLVDL
jgi:hypothetical protein